MEELEELEQLDDSEITAVSPAPNARVSVPPPIPKQALERSSLPPQARSSLPPAPPPAGASSAPPASGIFRIDDAAGMRPSTTSTGRVSAPPLMPPPRSSGTSPGISPLHLELDHLKRQVRELELKVRLRDDLIAELKRSLEEHKKAADLARQQAQEHAQRVSTAERKDDLKRIRGIGPTFERKLHALEVTRFSQIAGWNDAEVERIAQALQILPQRVHRDGWIESAARLLAE